MNGLSRHAWYLASLIAAAACTPIFLIAIFLWHGSQTFRRKHFAVIQ